MTHEERQAAQASDDGMREPTPAIEQSARAVPRGETLDQAHERLGHTAPRVTPADLEANIACEYTFTADKATQGCPQHESLSLLTLCVLVLRNGFTIVGKSAPASPANFSAELGAKLAREDAVKQLWPLMGYALREKLSQADER